VNVEALPVEPVVVGVHVTDLRRSRPHWLLVRAAEVSLCASNPGFAESLRLRGDRRTLVGWWRGDVSWSQARRQGLQLEGPPALVRAFPTWFARYVFAEVPPRSESRARI
jgi:hypothetical protein